MRLDRTIENLRKRCRFPRNQTLSSDFFLSRANGNDVPVKLCRQTLGFTPSAFLKCWRRDTAEPKPANSAIRSTGCSVVSSKRCANVSRSVCSQRCTVVPVNWRKCRVKLRRLIVASRARLSTLWAAWRRSRTASNSPLKRESRRFTGTGCSMNCACPPWRCGATTRALVALTVTVLGLSAVNVSDALHSVLEGRSTLMYWAQTGIFGTYLGWLLVFHFRAGDYA